MNSLITKIESILELANSDNLQQMLENLSGSNNQLDSEKWCFEREGIFTLDTVPLRLLSESNPTWCQSLGVNISWLAKLMFLYGNQGKRDIKSYRMSFDTICKTLFYLSENNKLIINKVDLDDYFSYLLMHTFEKGRPMKCLSPMSYHVFLAGLDIPIWMQVFKRYDLLDFGFSSSFSERIVDKVLKGTIDTLSAGDLTCRDWMEGGSFNHLTLDYGRYYVEHCSEFFKSHITLATALSHTLSQASEICTKAGLSRNGEGVRTNIIPMINQFLLGTSVEDLPSSYRNALKENWLINLQQATLTTFTDYLRIFRVQEILLSEIGIEKIAVKMSMSSLSSYKVERLKLLIEIRLKKLNFQINFVSPDVNRVEGNWLAENLKIDIKILNAAIDDVFHSLHGSVDVALPKIEFYQEIGLTIRNSIGSNYIREFIRSIEHAGVIQFVAFTGWRRSEYGFSISDIYESRNEDLLDQSTCPLRYEVFWAVPKTNGKTKVNREITLSAYRCSQQLASLVLAGNNKPCLYSFIKSTVRPESSGEHIKDAVVGMWLHFVNHYSSFLCLDGLDELNKLRKKMQKKTLNTPESKRYQELMKLCHTENWEHLNEDVLLHEARRRAREEYSRVKFFLYTQKGRDKMLIAYCDGTLSAQYQVLFDRYLSKKTKMALKRLTSEGSITAKSTKSVINEIMNDVLYPTPHAFRHMWAEAVYRRFDGDAGWMIRSTFKHVSQNMWLDYIRHKDNRRQHDKVKRRVISSLLSNYLHKAGKGYAGATDKLLRRLFLQTTVVDIEVMEKVEEFGQFEIVDIKANPWGYCLLRRRNQHRAKCAEEGVPQRHNASPSLCLGCGNNLTQEGNVEEILLAIGNDVKVLNTPTVPEFFRCISYDRVRNALMHLKKLDVDDEILDELQAALNVGRQRRVS